MALPVGLKVAVGGASLSETFESYALGAETPAPWTTTGALAAMTIVDDGAGGKCARLNWAGGAVTLENSTTIPIVHGAWYELSARVKSSGGAAVVSAWVVTDGAIPFVPISAIGLAGASWGNISTVIAFPKSGDTGYYADNTVFKVRIGMGGAGMYPNATYQNIAYIDDIVVQRIDNCTALGPGVNYLSNAGFNMGAICTVNQDVWQTAAGGVTGNCAKLFGNGTDGHQNGYLRAVAVHPSDLGGKRFVLSFSAKKAAAGSALFSAYLVDVRGNVVASLVNQSTSADTTWTRYSVAFNLSQPAIDGGYTRTNYHIWDNLFCLYFLKGSGYWGWDLLVDEIMLEQLDAGGPSAFALKSEMLVGFITGQQFNTFYPNDAITATLRIGNFSGSEFNGAYWVTVTDHLGATVHSFTASISALANGATQDVALTLSGIGATELGWFRVYCEVRNIAGAVVADEVSAVARIERNEDFTWQGDPYFGVSTPFLGGAGNPSSWNDVNGYRTGATLDAKWELIKDCGFRAIRVLQEPAEAALDAYPVDDHPVAEDAYLAGLEVLMTFAPQFSNFAGEAADFEIHAGPHCAALARYNRAYATFWETFNEPWTMVDALGDAYWLAVQKDIVEGILTWAPEAKTIGNIPLINTSSPYDLYLWHPATDFMGCVDILSTHDYGTAYWSDAWRILEGDTTLRDDLAAVDKWSIPFTMTEGSASELFGSSAGKLDSLNFQGDIYFQDARPGRFCWEGMRRIQELCARKSCGWQRDYSFIFTTPGSYATLTESSYAMFRRFWEFPKIFAPLVAATSRMLDDTRPYRVYHSADKVRWLMIFEQITAGDYILVLFSNMWPAAGGVYPWACDLPKISGATYAFRDCMRNVFSPTEDADSYSWNVEGYPDYVTYSGSITALTAAIETAGDLARSARANRRPRIARVNVTPSDGQVNQTLQFSAVLAVDDGDIAAITYAWDFGDTGTSTAAAPTHAYATASTFTASLTVSDGTLTDTQSVKVRVGQTRIGGIRGAKGLIAHWPLTPESLKAATIYGERIRGLDATATGSPAVANDRMGQARALTLDGTNDYLEIPDHALLSFGNGSADSAFTLMAWLYWTAPNILTISKGTLGTDAEWMLLAQRDGTVSIRCYDESVDNCWIGRRKDAALTGAGWTHIAATYDATELASGLKLYVNGVRADEYDATSYPAAYAAMEAGAGPLLVGRYGASPYRYSTGRIQGLRLYSRELMDTEIWEIARKYE